MTTEITQVNLGFAEFVGQLLDETFEAILGAQGHQSDRRRDLEDALELSDDEFKVRHLGDEDQTLVGEPLAELVERHKLALRESLRNLQSARLVVDSGEIRARLELSSLSSATVNATPPPDKSNTTTDKSNTTTATSKTTTATSKTTTATSKTTTDESKTITATSKTTAATSRTTAATAPAPAPAPKPAEPAPSVSTVERNGTRLLEIRDGDRTTLLVDPTTLAARTAANPRLGQVRMIASPARPTSTLQSLSEVVIRFKTV